LLFFREHRYLKSWQLSVVLSGLGVILIGLAVGRLDPPDDKAASNDVEMVADIGPSQQVIAAPSTDTKEAKP